jgi:acetoin utilization protein AcuC
VLNPGDVVDCTPGSDSDLLLFHSARYLEALHEADTGEPHERLFDYGLGLQDNPVFKGVLPLCHLFAGQASKATELVLAGEECVFVPCGGFHHAMRERAGGFCYVNDIGMVIERLLASGKRIMYVDIDAHHGDGIEDAFISDPRVMKVSFHESGKTLFPFTGFETETGSGDGTGYNINVPLAAATDDEVFLWLFKQVFAPLAFAFRPDVVLAEIGVDMMNSDPLTHLRLTNNGYVEAVRVIRVCSDRLVCFGGGGYNADNITKGYTLAWALMNRIDIFDDYSSAMLGGTFLGSSELGNLSALRDMNLVVTGPEKAETYHEARRVLEYLRENIFPLHGIKQDGGAGSEPI